MARAMLHDGNLRRWQDTALNLASCTGEDVKGAALASSSLLHDNGGSSNIQHQDLGFQVTRPGGAYALHYGVEAHTVSYSIADATCLDSASDSPRVLREISDDSQLIHALFPEVIASVSAEQDGIKLRRKGPLGLNLNHSDVLRAWDNQPGPVGQQAATSMCAHTIFEALHIEPAQTALEALCGPLPCYGTAQAAARGLPPVLIHAQQTQQNVCSESAWSGSMPSTEGHNYMSLEPSALQPFLSRQGSLNAVSAHGSCSTGSLSRCSSPVSHRGSPKAMQPLDTLLDGVSMEVDASELVSNAVCLKVDLEEFTASLKPSLRSGSEEFGILLSDSEDASDGTHVPSGHLWGNWEDAYESIFGRDDADAFMDVNSCHTMFVEEGDPMPARIAEDQRCLHRSSYSRRGGFADAAASIAVPVVPLLVPTTPISSVDMFSSVSIAESISRSFDNFDHDSTLGFGALMPALGQRDPLLSLHDGSFFADPMLAELPQSLAAIPAKTAVCAKSARAACAAKCKVKRQNRHPAKICYEMRKTNADKRPRIKGRFVKRADLIAQQAEQHCEATAATALSDDLTTCFSYPTNPYLDEIYSM